MHTPQQLVSEQVYNQFLDQLTILLERPICQTHFVDLAQKYVNDPNRMPTIMLLDNSKRQLAKR